MEYVCVWVCVVKSLFRDPFQNPVVQETTEGRFKLLGGVHPEQPRARNGHVEAKWKSSCKVSSVAVVLSPKTSP